MNCEKCKSVLTKVEIDAIEQLKSYRPQANVKICMDCLEDRIGIIGQNGNIGYEEMNFNENL